jgi:hypothetical protein
MTTAEPQPKPTHPEVEMRASPDGVLTYLVRRAPEALPPVTSRDLMAAWDAARTAAAKGTRSGDLDHGRGAARLFRFHRGDGSVTDLALADRDARCWAGAVDGTTGMHTAYGLSLCLRLLALVDLLAHAAWTHGMISLTSGGTVLDPALLRAAAYAPLTAEARFDEHSLRGDLATAPLSPSRKPSSRTTPAQNPPTESPV